MISVAQVDRYICEKPLWVVDSMVLLVYAVILTNYMNMYSDKLKAFKNDEIVNQTLFKDIDVKKSEISLF